MSIVLLVLFVVTMFVWLLSMLTPASNPPSGITIYSPWLCWFACFFLGLAVFATAWFVK